MGATAGFQAEVLGDLTWALNDSSRLQYGELPVGGRIRERDGGLGQAGSREGREVVEFWMCLEVED